MTARRPQRGVSYQWKLRELMASRGLFNAPDLEPLLAERGITLSSVQVWRLVAQVPERLSLQLLAALCDIFEVTPAELITTSAGNVQPRKAASAGPAAVPDPDALRPRPARLRPAE
jgi:DNA-binding Xre family transcriptional regulator